LTWVEQGDQLFLLVAASTAPTNLVGYIFVEDRAGQIAPTEVFILGADLTADRTIQTGFSKVIGATGKVVGASIGGTVPLKRGELYAMLVVNHRSIAGDDVICKGYVYNTNPVGMGEFIESVRGRGFVVTNQGETTLVNNVTATRTVTVPTNARWLTDAGHIFNADDVTRNTTVIIRDGSDNLLEAIEADATPTLVRKSFPHDTQTAIQNMESTDAHHLVMAEGHDILFAWTAGGASAGGTATSSLTVEEWIEI